MGRIKTQLLKRFTRKIMSAHGSELSDDFVKNKGLLPAFASIPSKKLRNIIAGYVTRLNKADKRKN